MNTELSDPAAAQPDNAHAPADIIIALDLSHPLSYLGFQATCAALDSLNVAVQWQPHRVAPLTRLHPDGPGNDRSTRHRWNRTQYQLRELALTAAGQGKTLRGIERRTDPTPAHAGMLWLDDQGNDAALRRYIDVVLRRTWEHADPDPLELDDSDAIARLVATLTDTASADQFQRWFALEAASRLADPGERLSAAGLAQTPGYLTQGEPSLGRAHLPMVSWIASGRTGPAPI